MSLGPVLMLVFIPVLFIAIIGGYLFWFFRNEEKKR